MAYPWPGFGTFQFTKYERPAYNADTGWKPSISTARNRALGALTDSVVTMALGSLEREFSVMLSQSRMEELQALVGTTATFTGWTRPTPDSRPAYLESVVQDAEILRTSNKAGEQTDERRNVRVSLTSQ